tara:strand:+ start:108193 stop:108459 length:267 start_codon:yes stop_codon:yes gene_type:complete
MIPINNAAAASSVAQTTMERRDNVSQSKVVSVTVTEDEAAISAKRSEGTKVVKETDKVQAKPRDEERSAKDQSEGREEKRGNLTDIYV